MLNFVNKSLCKIQACYYDRILKMTELRKIAAILLIILIVSVEGFSTHNRAGEITYRQISDLTFEFTITTFTLHLVLPIAMNWM